MSMPAAAVTSGEQRDHRRQQDGVEQEFSLEAEFGGPVGEHVGSGINLAFPVEAVFKRAYSSPLLDPVTA
jgi:hypothetical protein